MGDGDFVQFELKGLKSIRKKNVWKCHPEHYLGAPMSDFF